MSRSPDAAMRPVTADDAAVAPHPGVPTEAPLPRRLLSMTYEAMLLFAVVFVAGYLFDTLTQSRDALRFRHLRQAWLFVVLGAYFTWFWTHGGQTLAMKTWRVRLVDARGATVATSRAIVRYLLLWIVVLPTLAIVAAAGTAEWVAVAALAAATLVAPAFAIVDPERRFLHDRIAGTRVVASE